MIKGQKGFAHPFLLLIFVIVIAAVGFAGYRVYKKHSPNPLALTSEASPGCNNKGTVPITASPIGLSDILYIEPMGLEIGGHVTPIDHGYFYIKGAFVTPSQQAAVYSPIDGTVTNVGRTVRQGDPAAKADTSNTATYDDDAITIEGTCTFRVRFSNLVKFAGPLAEKIGTMKDNENKNPNYKIKAGELVGYTGQPTANGIDVWVENDEKTLTGFIHPEQYTKAEAWKTHVVDFFENTSEPLKAQLLAYSTRGTAPFFGKIDYDLPGKLVGTWFREGSGGYSGNQKGSEGYWDGHLSIVPEGHDPSQTVISFGNYQGKAQQFAVVGNTPDPAKVDQSTGLVKYELGQISYVSADTGQPWDIKTATHVKAKAGAANGTVLIQMTGNETIKMETFPGKTTTQVSGFTSNAKIYTR
jgi:hypothetical protein